MKKLLNEFAEYLRDCGEDAFFLFDDTEAAIESFLKHREEQNG